MAEHCRRYPFYKKKLRIKIVQNSIFYKKFSQRICLIIPGVEVGARKIAIFEILEWESKFTLGLNAAKDTDICINKNFKYKLFKIQFPTKNSVGAFVYLSH